MLPNRTGVFVGLESSALTWNPVPGVKKTTPRGELKLKKLAGKLLGAAKASGTPSQLISRRPSGNDPPTPLLAPRNVRKALTVARMSDGLAPDASKTTGAATAIVGNERINAAKASATCFIVVSSRITLIFGDYDVFRCFAACQNLLSSVDVMYTTRVRAARLQKLERQGYRVTFEPTG